MAAHHHDDDVCPRGVVTDMKTGVIIMPNVENQRIVVSPEIPNGYTVIGTMYEHAEVRVYRACDQWMCSTATKLDARRSLWCTDERTPRVGEVFFDSLESHRGISDLFNSDLLDVNRTYTFMVITPHVCRRVAKHDIAGKVYMKENDDDDVWPGWRAPDGRTDLRDMSYPFADGYGKICRDNDTGTLVGVVCPEYAYMSSVMGASQSPYSAYVNNLHDPIGMAVIRRIHADDPERIQRFDKYEDIIDDVAVQTYNRIFYDTPSPNYIIRIADACTQHYSSCYNQKSNFVTPGTQELDELNLIRKFMREFYHKPTLNKILRNIYKRR